MVAPILWIVRSMMPVFHDADDVYRNLGGLFEYVVADESLAPVAAATPVPASPRNNLRPGKSTTSMQSGSVN